MESSAGGAHSDSDFRSLFSIPLSSLFNFQRNNQPQQEAQQQPPPQPPVPLIPTNGFDANYLRALNDEQQLQLHQDEAWQSRHHHSFSRQHHSVRHQRHAANNAPLNYFTSQSSADSAHYSGNEEEQGGSPLIKRDVSTPINLMEFGFEPSEMEIDSEEMSLPASVLMSGRPNHSEVEKLRRDRMNSSINAMARLVPACRSASRKLDKLTVLRLAAQHIKLLRARSSSLMHTPADLFSGEELQLLLSDVSQLSLRD
uniref:BHLH domain-containing protein n=1 Tax=Macrostomum lignano TaxID=282301 RepID=A0A1I8INN4_9PLAT